MANRLRSPLLLAAGEERGYTEKMAAVDLRKVVVLGTVFPYAEKAPFVGSGKSVFAAIECSPDEKQVRCHECGEWLRAIGGHALLVHGITASTYKLKHGLNKGTSLDAPGYHKRRMQEAVSRLHATAGNSISGLRPQRSNAPGINKGKPRIHLSSELANSRGKCKAQMIYKIIRFKKEHGRNPSENELGMGHHSLMTLFRVESYTEILRIVEAASFCQDERMPWPEDYAAVMPSSPSSLGGVA